jgi:hypothetical protein
MQQPAPAQPIVIEWEYGQLRIETDGTLTHCCNEKYNFLSEENRLAKKFTSSFNASVLDGTIEKFLKEQALASENNCGQADAAALAEDCTSSIQEPFLACAGGKYQITRNSSGDHALLLPSGATCSLNSILSAYRLNVPGNSASASLQEKEPQKESAAKTRQRTEGERMSLEAVDCSEKAKEAAILIQENMHALTVLAKTAELNLSKIDQAKVSKHEYDEYRRAASVIRTHATNAENACAKKDSGLDWIRILPSSRAQWISPSASQLRRNLRRYTEKRKNHLYGID